MLRSALRDLRPAGRSAEPCAAATSISERFHATNSPYEDLDRCSATLRFGPADVIVDVGCGKGRSLNWLIDHFPANAIYGIELDPELCAANRQAASGGI